MIHWQKAGFLIGLVVLVGCGASPQAPVAALPSPTTALPSPLTATEVPSLSEATIAPTELPTSEPTIEATLESTAEPTAEATLAPTLSPTSPPLAQAFGEELLFLRDDSLIAYDLTSGAERRLADAVASFLARPDGREIAVVLGDNHDQLWVIDRSGEQRQQVTVPS